MSRIPIFTLEVIASTSLVQELLLARHDKPNRAHDEVQLEEIDFLLRGRIIEHVPGACISSRLAKINECLCKETETRRKVGSHCRQRKREREREKKIRDR